MVAEDHIEIEKQNGCITQILKDGVAEAHYDEVVGYRRELDAGVYTLLIYTYDENRTIEEIRLKMKRAVRAADNNVV